MDDAELVGGVLVTARNPQETAFFLKELLLQPVIDHVAVLRAGLDPALVEALRDRMDSEPARIEAACREGAAWVLGRRSIGFEAPWELVASLPQGTDLPSGLRRSTGETMTQIVVEATETLRLAVPFIDRSGLLFLGEALAAATARGVALEILLPTRSSNADDALAELERLIRLEGAVKNFSTSRLMPDSPWAHLKVLASDASVAYVGSANVTGAGLAGRNLELGVLVRGHAVLVIENILKLFRQS